MENFVINENFALPQAQERSDPSQALKAQFVKIELNYQYNIHFFQT